ncbi:hypothetical protein [Aeoliella sp. SH292]|uniref:hypothetical protein n=1 Tax=Aeoliella sp. SH292 TaxID=3454464 RepID=UPI003F9C01A6
MFHRSSRLLFLLLFVAGCETGPELGTVTGQLLIQGQPGNKVRIEFLPDVGTSGPSSVAETDSDGRFSLQLMDRTDTPSEGAIVGQHRVVLSDLQLAESATGRGIPIRFGVQYTMPSETPLRQTVVAGPQQITIEIP